MDLKLLRTLPKKLINRFRVLVLADTGFSSVEFVNGVEKLRHLGLASFGQQKLLGVYRWLRLSLISFVLTHWVYLSLQRITLLDWKEAALLTLQQLLPKTAVNLLLIEIERKRELLASQGLTLENVGR